MNIIDLNLKNVYPTRGGWLTKEKVKIQIPYTDKKPIKHKVNLHYYVVSKDERTCFITPIICDYYELIRAILKELRQDVKCCSKY